MTREELIQIIAKKLHAKNKGNGTWSDLVSGVQKMTQQERAQLVSKLGNGHYDHAGKMLARALNDEVMIKSQAEAEAMLADDTLSLAELELILN